MKRILIFLMICTMSVCLWAETEANTEAQNIRLTACVDPSLGYNQQVEKLLLNKMNQIITKEGLGSSEKQRFIITANVSVLSEDVIVTTKELFQYELEVTLYIGDGQDGTLFASASQTLKGQGESKAAAYIAALKKIKPAEPAFKVMITKGKKRILELTAPSATTTEPAEYQGEYQYFW